LQNNSTQSESKFIFGFLFLFTLLSVSFFGPVFLEEQRYTVYVYAFLNILLLPNVFFFYLKKNSGYLFMGAMKLINLSVFISLFCSYYFWEQSLSDGLLAILYPVAGYNLYFYLVKKNVSVATIERIILIMGLASVVAFLISFMIFPRQIFINPYDNEDLTRGFQRIQLSGFGFIYLFFFMSLNKIFISKQGNIKWIIFAIAAYTCILMSLTRTYIAFTTIIALVYLFRNSKMYVKGLIIGTLIIAIFVIPNLSFVQKMVETTKGDVAESKDYIRIRAAQYFLDNFQPSVFTRILGNGFSYGDKSDYGKFMTKLNLSEFYYIEDLGLIGLYVYLGVLAVLAYIIIFYKGLTQKLSSEMNYLRMFIAYLLFIGLNSYATYNTSFLLCIVFVLYLYEANKNSRTNVPEVDKWNIETF